MRFAKQGIILMNLGSPDSTAVPDVRRYLNEFLMDEKVIDIHPFWRTILVKGIIAPFRASRSAKAYSKIWWKEGSPLIVLTQRLQHALQMAMPEMPVEIAMRYGRFSPKEAFDNFRKNHPDIEEIILVPLYPHYAMSSYETAAEYAKLHHQKGNYPFDLKIVPPFYNDPKYIHALTEHIGSYIKNEKWDHILFSYHGIPERHVRKTDPTGSHCLATDKCCDTPSVAHAFCYKHQDIVTTSLVAAGLNLPKGKFSMSFQSRLGRKWLQPYTDKRLEEMPKEGIKNLLIVCPAFVSDCLETLEEIEQEGAETFLESGGETFKMIPCLNDSPLFVNALKGLIEQQISKDATTV